MWAGVIFDSPFYFASFPASSRISAARNSMTAVVWIGAPFANLTDSSLAFINFETLPTGKVKPDF